MNIHKNARLTPPEPAPAKAGVEGKAERFIQTSLREWAYAIPQERRAALAPWLDRYNTERPHARPGPPSASGSAAPIPVA